MLFTTSINRVAYGAREDLNELTNNVRRSCNVLNPNIRSMRRFSILLDTLAQMDRIEIPVAPESFGEDVCTYRQVITSQSRGLSRAAKRENIVRKLESIFKRVQDNPERFLEDYAPRILKAITALDQLQFPSIFYKRDETP